MRLPRAAGERGALKNLVVHDAVERLPHYSRGAVHACVNLRFASPGPGHVVRCAPQLAWKSAPFVVCATKPARITKSPNRSPASRAAA
jgi:hypothetical protein